MSDPQPDRIELEAAGDCPPIDGGTDRRLRMDQPLPVRLVAVADVILPTQARLKAALDRFYVDLLEFAKGPADGEGQWLSYRADNFNLRFAMREGLIERSDYRPAMIEVRSLADIEHKLVDAEIEYLRQKTVAVGEESLVLRDPAGNWIEIVEWREIR